MPTTPEASDFARRQAVRTADQFKQLDEQLSDLLREESRRLLGRLWLENALASHVNESGADPDDGDFMVLTVWILYHYRSSATDGLPFAAWWAERRRLRREPAKARLVQAHVDAPIGLWEVQEIERGRGSLLRDLLSGETVFVLDRSSTETLQPWLVLCGYVVKVDGIAFLGGVHLQPLLPADAEVVAKAVRRLAKTRRKVVPLELRTDPAYQAAVLGAWRYVADDVVHQPMPQMHNTDGDPMELQRDEFTLHATAAEVVQRLAAIPGAQPPEREGRNTVIAVTAPSRSGSSIPGETVIGQLTVTPKRMRAETNSVKRADALRAAVEAAAGEMVSFRLRVAEDLEAMLEERSGANQAPSRGKSTGGGQAVGAAGPAFSSLDDPANLPPEVRAALAEMAEQEQLRWPDYELPALDGMTARQAARDRRMRPRLVRLLKDMEARSASAPHGNAMALDMARLRKELGV